MHPTQAQVSKTRGATVISTAPEYRLLGLRPREARLEVIREALSVSATNLREDGLESGGLEDQRLAEIAVAGYRLMDPRRRPNLLERVQLLLWTEEEIEQPAQPLWHAEQLAKPQVRSESGEEFSRSSSPASGRPAGQASRVDVVARPVMPGNVLESESLMHERQVAMDVFRMLRQKDRHATALRIAVVALAFSLASAVALVSAFLLN